MEDGVGAGAKCQVFRRLPRSHDPSALQIRRCLDEGAASNSRRPTSRAAQKGLSEETSTQHDDDGRLYTSLPHFAKWLLIDQSKQHLW